MKLFNFLTDISKLTDLVNSLLGENDAYIHLNKLNKKIREGVQGLLSGKIEIEDVGVVQENATNFKALFDDSTDAMLIIKERIFVDCNKATLDMLRLQDKTQVFNTHPSLLSPEYQPDRRMSAEKAEEMMEIAFEKGSHRFEWVHKRADGELFYAEVLLTRINHNNSQFLHCVWRDITNRKNAEKALEASEKNYKFLFHEAADGILVGNEKGIIINANSCIQKISGYPSDELIGQSIDILFPKEVLHENPLRYDLVNEGVSVLRERILRKKDGSTILIEMNTKKIEDGRLQAYIRDITERKINEQKLVEKNRELQLTKNELKTSNSELQQLNNLLFKQKEQLKKAKEKAEESDRLKSAFLANMSHEIRTPMNGILGFAELLQMKDINKETQKMYLGIIEQSGNRMLDILNNLIDISKIESGQVDMKFELLNLNNLMEDLFKFFLPEAKNKNIEFKYTNTNSKQEINILTDKAKLSQVISNLVKNAIKFTDKGAVEFGWVHMNNSITINVKDTGIGIDPKFKEEIFQRFRQADSTRALNIDGAGLGLSISKAFVSMLGGEMDYDSQIGKGSNFYFTLPYHIS